MMETSFNGYRVTAQCRGGDNFVHMLHNARCPFVISAEDHIDPKLPHEILVDYGSVQKAFDIIFSEAVSEYNRGKKPSRQIKDYYEQIRSDSRKGTHKNKNADGSRKPAYEFILQIGRRDEHPDNNVTAEILRDFTMKWLPFHYPNMAIIQNTIHADEFSRDAETGERILSPCHCHLDIVYVAHSLTSEELEKENERRKKLKQEMMEEAKSRGEKWDEKKWQKRSWQRELVALYGKSLSTGMSLQCSMTAALAEMGFFTEKGKGTAQQQFEEQVRHDLQDFAERYGVKIDRSKGEKHRHIEKKLYQQKCDSERKSKQLQAAQTRLDGVEEKLNRWENEVKGKARELAEKEESLNQKSETLEREKSEQVETAKTLALRENEIVRTESLYAEKKAAIESFDGIGKEVRRQSLAFDSAEKELYENTRPPAERIKTFVGRCKMILAEVSAELARYKNTFRNFWRATPDFFRKLAASMERNKCETFAEYTEKRSKRQLVEQVEERNRIQSEFEAKKKKIVRDYGGVGY